MRVTVIYTDWNGGPLISDSWYFQGSYPWYFGLSGASYDSQGGYALLGLSEYTSA
ncbi:MAG: hypothetical protein ABL921_27805 [Pirellula sp.]